jgi:uncharacterized protein involved in type VI secretion and phage assembly
MALKYTNWTFSTSAQGQTADKFRILAFSGEDSICQGYVFDILLAVASLTRESDIQAFLQDMAEADTFTLQGGTSGGSGAPAAFTWIGMPERVEWLFTAADGSAILRAVLRPHSYKLRLSTHSRIFLGADLPNLINNLLIAENFIAAADFSTDGLGQGYRARPLSCQYNESSFDFLLRHLERVGGYSYIEQFTQSAGGQTVTKDRLVLADEGTVVPGLPGGAVLDWQPQASGVMAVTSFSRTMATSPTSVTLRDYGTEITDDAEQSFSPPSIPAIDVGKNFAPLRGGGESGWYGRFNMFGEMALDDRNPENAQNQALLMARARARALVVRSNQAMGAGAVAWMRAGYSFSLSGKIYQLVRVKHYCNLCSTVNDPVTVGQAIDLGFNFELGRAGYNNSFACHPLELGSFAPESSVPRPVAGGLAHATILASGTGVYADLDNQGRYTANLHFPEAVYNADGSEQADAGVPLRLRLMQPHAGAASGVHFPLPGNTEALVAFTDGDPDRPVILGALPNPLNPSVVTSGDTSVTPPLPDTHEKNIIKTPSGHILELDDNRDAPKITLTSKNGHILTLDDTARAPQITLQSNHGHKLTLDDSAAAPKITLTSRGGRTLTLDDTATAPKIALKSPKGHVLTMDDTPSSSRITLQSKNGHTIAVNDDDTANAIKIASADGKMSLVMDQAKGALITRYGENSTKLTGAKAYELVTTHKESTVGGNVYSSTLGATESFTVGEKLTMAAALSQTVNLLVNMTLNIGVNNTLNLGRNSTSNVGSTMNFNTTVQTVNLSADEIGMSRGSIFANMILI